MNKQKTPTVKSSRMGEASRKASSENYANQASAKNGARGDDMKKPPPPRPPHTGAFTKRSI